MIFFVYLFLLMPFVMCAQDSTLVLHDDTLPSAWSGLSSENLFSSLESSEGSLPVGDHYYLFQESTQQVPQQVVPMSEVCFSYQKKKKIRRSLFGVR